MTNNTNYTLNNFNMPRTMTPQEAEYHALEINTAKELAIYPFSIHNLHVYTLALCRAHTAKDMRVIYPSERQELITLSSVWIQILSDQPSNQAARMYKAIAYHLQVTTTELDKIALAYLRSNK